MVRSPAARVALVDVVAIAVFTLLSEDFVFFGVENAQNVAVDTTQIALLAVGLAVLLGAGELDLSIGANLVLCSVVGARVIEAVGPVGLGGVLGLFACVAAGAGVGAVNGAIVAFGRVNSLIATLGTMGVAQGVALLWTRGGDIGGLPLELQDAFGRATVAGVPVPALVALAVAGAAAALLRYTRFGVRTLAAGSSRLAAERSGVPVRGHLVKLFALTGSLCGLAGFVDLSRFTATAVSGHELDALAAITAVVIGGTALSGGRVSIAGAVLGALLTVILQVGLVVLGVAAFWQLIAIGVTLVVAVVLQRA